MSLLLAFSLLSSVIAAVPLSSVQPTTPTTVVPNRFIVELDTISDLPQVQAEKRDVHKNFYSALTERGGGNFKVDREFHSANVFVGAAITVTGNQTLIQISEIPGVKAIRPVVQFPAPKPVKKVIPTGPDDPLVPMDRQSTHIMTGVDKLHAQGIFGQGIKIGIVDTGTDYTHPYLGGGFGRGKKVAGGFDFVGDAFNGANTPNPDTDPLDQCNGHGTHVAGIIGANPGNEYDISGVAYQATLFSYRIFGCTGTVPDDIIIAALLRGMSDGVDILTLSLGRSDGWTEATVSIVASRLAKMGKVVTVAAGNNGNFGSWFASAPGNGMDVISVASVDNTVMPIQTATTSDPAHPKIPYLSLLSLPAKGSLPVFVISNDTTVVDDACSPLPPKTPNLSSFVVIIRRGTCDLSVKLKNIADKGAKVSLIYNNVPGLSSISTGKFTTGLIDATDGQFLVNQFAAGKKISIAFPVNGQKFGQPDPTGGLVSTFSSYGPTYDLFFKPAIAAPGGNILSTYPVRLGSFAILSGTSMATPFLAGSSALLLQVKGKSQQVISGVRTRFETTAQAIPSTKNDADPLQTLTQQGTGLINVFNALNFDTLVSPGELILNDSTHFSGLHTITIRNTGNRVQIYKLSHVPAGTAVTVRPGTNFPSGGPVPLTKNFATVLLSRATLTIPPGSSNEVQVTITPPARVDQKTFPVYAGFVQIQSMVNGELLHVAYQGLASALKTMAVLDRTDVFSGKPGVNLPLISNLQGVQVNPTNYTFVNSNFPTLHYRLDSGTPKLLIDLVKSDFDLRTANLEPRGLPSDWTPHLPSFGKVVTVGPLAAFNYMARNTDGVDEAHGRVSTFPFARAVFANNSAIANGQYKILLRALKITGNPTIDGDYESYLSPIIGVNKH